MKFTVKKLSVDTVDVEFEDGTTASVFTSKGQTQADLIGFIASFHNASEQWEKIEDIPVKVGGTYEYIIPKLDDEIDYKEARSYHYPNIGNQLDSLYWERQGDDTQRKAYDARIKNVKDKITKDKTYKRSEIETLLD